jgi:hypothetical protein
MLPMVSIASTYEGSTCLKMKMYYIESHVILVRSTFQIQMILLPLQSVNYLMVDQGKTKQASSQNGQHQ